MIKMSDDKKIFRMMTPASLHVREAGEGQESRRIEGYAIMFGVRSAVLWTYDGASVREVIAPGAVTKELLDQSDIKMTMFHDREKLLARSRNGEGTLSYEVDEKGVRFCFDAPRTQDGDAALELVRRGDIAGCSFAFTADFSNPLCVERAVCKTGEGTEITYTVRQIDGIYDFTLAADPAYPDTSVAASERDALAAVEDALRKKAENDKKKISEQVREMRRAAGLKL
jgi:HK97 family phage prohead protease